MMPPSACGSHAVIRKPRAAAARDSSADQIAIETLVHSLKKRSRRKLAVFLGAGASKPFGYPLTRELMLEILKQLREGSILQGRGSKSDKKSERPCAELLDFLYALLPGKRVSAKVVPTVTSVLSLLDYSLASGQAILAKHTLDETRRARQLLERALLEVIPDEDYFSPDESTRFDRFTGWLCALRNRRPPGGLGIITTNYDMLADLAAIRAADVAGSVGHWSLDDLASKVDYGFRWLRADRKREELIPRPLSPVVSLYKLHGSTNWLRCPLCENLYVNPNGPIAWDAFEPTSDNECHCSETRLVPQIVSPSFVREMRDPNLAAVWKSALDLLREADHWLIVGYSFPDEDVGIRALFTRAFGSRRGTPLISVVQGDERARVNYECFFPAGSVSYLATGLESVLKHVSS